MGRYAKGSEEAEGPPYNVVGWDIPGDHMLIKCSCSIGKYGW